MEKERIELQKKIEKYLKSLLVEFPNIMRRMYEDGSFASIQDIVKNRFSRTTVDGMSSYFVKIFREETIGYITLGDVKILLEIVEKRIQVLQGENGDISGLEALRKCLNTEVAGSKLMKDEEAIRSELKNLTSDRSLLSLEVASAISSGFIEISNGKKPEDIGDLKKLILKAESLVRMQQLAVESEKIFAEKVSIVKNVQEFGNARDLDKLILTKEALRQRIRDLNRHMENHQDIVAKEQAEKILAKINKIIQIEKKLQEWMDVANQCEMYFAIYGSNDNIMELLGLSAMMGAGCTHAE